MMSSWEEFGDRGALGAWREWARALVGAGSDPALRDASDEELRKRLNWLVSYHPTRRFGIGAQVVTTRDAGAQDWGEGSTRSGVRWGVRGIVVAVHDAHGLFYEVKQDDGTLAPYEHDELTAEPEDNDELSRQIRDAKPIED